MSLEYVVVGGSLDVETLKGIIKNGYHNPQSPNVNGYEIDPHLSDKKVQVYHHPNKNHVVINHSGTKDYMDMLTDLMLVNGYKENSRFQRSKKATEKTKQKYGADKEYTHVSHSLSFQTARDANRNDKFEHISLNPAITHYDLFDMHNYPKEKIIKSDVDLTSMIHDIQPFQSKERTIYIPHKSYNIIDEHKTDVLDRLPQDMII